MVIMATKIVNIYSKTNIKIIQLNVLSWNNPARRLWISLYLNVKSPDIVLLNSTSLNNPINSPNIKNTITAIFEMFCINTIKAT